MTLAIFVIERIKDNYTLFFSIRGPHSTDHDLSTSQTVCRVKVGKSCLGHFFWWNNL